MDYGQTGKMNKTGDSVVPEIGLDPAIIGENPAIEEFKSEESRSVPGEIGLEPEPSAENNNDLIDVALPPNYNAEELGQIVVADPKEAGQPMIAAFDQKTIRTSGDHIDKRAIRTVKTAESKFYHDGDIADFYDIVRGEEGMMSANLKNSFNRELGKDA